MPAPKPHRLKLLQNTARPGRLPDATSPLPKLDVAPSSPAWMSEEAAGEFEHLAGMLAKSGVLTGGHLPLLEQFSVLSSSLKATWRSGELPSAAHLAQYRLMSHALGLTGLPVAPTSQAEEERNAFAGNVKLFEAQRKGG